MPAWKLNLLAAPLALAFAAGPLFAGPGPGGGRPGGGGGPRPGGGGVRLGGPPGGINYGANRPGIPFNGGPYRGNNGYRPLGGGYSGFSIGIGLGGLGSGGFPGLGYGGYNGGYRSYYNSGPLVGSSAYTGPAPVISPDPHPFPQTPLAPTYSTAIPVIPPVNADSALRVTGVDAGPASRAGLQAGDIIVKVDGTRVKTFDDFRASLTAARDGVALTVYSPTTGRTTIKDVAVEDTRIGVSVVETPVVIDE